MSFSTEDAFLDPRREQRIFDLIFDRQRMSPACTLTATRIRGVQELLWPESAFCVTLRFQQCESFTTAQYVMHTGDKASGRFSIQ